MAWFAPEAVGSRRERKSACTRKKRMDGRLSRPNSLDAARKTSWRLAVLALVAWTTASHAQTVDAAAPTAPVPQQQSAPLAGTAPAGDGLSDLNAMTFSCVRAGLNAAAREAAKAKSQGTYQFSYFKIINDTHHSSYEVHFKSNYSGEPDLKYCVAIYCQQGWDPKTTQISVRPMSNERQPVQVAAHGADCGNEQMPVKRRAKR